MFYFLLTYASIQHQDSLSWHLDTKNFLNQIFLKLSSPFQHCHFVNITVALEDIELLCLTHTHNSTLTRCWLICNNIWLRLPSRNYTKDRIIARASKHDFYFYPKTQQHVTSINQLDGTNQNGMVKQSSYEHNIFILANTICHDYF